MSILHLPYELVAYVIRNLDLIDIYSLSSTCRHLNYLVREARTARWLLGSTAPFSAEARDARVSGAYAKELRRLLKRRDAIASVSPYLVAVVALAREWLYQNGVLCYVRNLELRVLDLHRSAAHEVVVDVRKLLSQALAEWRPRQKYRLRLLYYSHSIVSFVYTQAGCGHDGYRHWLLASSPREGRIITAREIASIDNLFVRNNDCFLYFGHTSEPDDAGFEHWVIRSFDITTLTWLDRSLTIPCVIGTDIDSTVCFEIFDGYFYGLSNQRTLDVEEVDWLSYYSCFRFPLTPRGFDHFEEPPERQLWRRDHKEGPLDDRWTFLRMVKDEATGQLQVIESRQEYPEGRTTATRIYYTTPIDFDKANKFDEAAPDALGAKVQQDEAPRRRPRDPHLVQPGDDSSTMSATLSRCSVRSYHPACQTFIDLVDDSASFDPRDRRLRLRGGTRRLRPPAEQRPQPTADGEQDHDTLMRQVDGLYTSQTGIFWPPEPSPDGADAALAGLYEVLNPPGHSGQPHGSWDERSMVYSAGTSRRGLQALVFVSWDPSIYLAGTVPYPGALSFGRPAGNGQPPGSYGHRGDKAMCERDSGQHPRFQPDITPGRGASQGPGLPSSGVDDASAAAWCKIEPARYRDIARGYHFFY